MIATTTSGITGLERNLGGKVTFFERIAFELTRHLETIRKASASRGYANSGTKDMSKTGL